MTIRSLFFISVFIIFILSIVNTRSIPSLNYLLFDADKTAHVLTYFYLTYLGLLSGFNISKFTLFLMIFTFGFFIEIIHIFHPYRYFEYFDLLANLFGVTIALLINKLKS